VNHDVRHGRRQPKRLRFALPVAQTRLQALRAHGEIQQLRRALELYRASGSSCRLKILQRGCDDGWRRRP
jgi:hypothetical protein